MVSTRIHYDRTSTAALVADHERRQPIVALGAKAPRRELNVCDHCGEHGFSRLRLVIDSLTLRATGAAAYQPPIIYAAMIAICGGCHHERTDPMSCTTCGFNAEPSRNGREEDYRAHSQHAYEMVDRTSGRTGTATQVHNLRRHARSYAAKLDNLVAASLHGRRPR